MSRIAKIIGIVVGALVVLVVAALVVVGMLLDPNDYKDDITAAVARATGRQLTLDGDLSLELFPTVRIAVGSASLSNAQGFGSEPMAKIGSAELRLALLPLLSGKVHVGQARLTGLELNLARDARGRNNWQDLGGPEHGGRARPRRARPAGSSSIDLGIDSIEIADARVTWNDASTGSRWELTSFALDADDFGLGKKFPLDMRFALAGANVAVKVDGEHAGDALARRERVPPRAARREGVGQRRGLARRAGRRDAEGRLARREPRRRRRSSSSGLALNFLGITMAGSLSGQKLMSDLSLSGAVDIREFNPRDVLERAEGRARDGRLAACSRARARRRICSIRSTPARTPRHAAQARRLDAQRAASASKARKLAYSLAIDDINIDRYLPPSEESGAPADEGSLDAVDLPLDVLRTLNAQGELKFGKAKFSGLTLTNAAFGLTAANGTRALEAQRVALRRHLRRRHHRDRAERCRAHRCESADRRRGPRAARPGPARLCGRRGHGRREARPRRERLEPRPGAPRARRQRVLSP